MLIAGIAAGAVGNERARVEIKSDAAPAIVPHAADGGDAAARAAGVVTSHEPS